MIVCNFFFFTDTATTEIYTLSLHDALPILAAEEMRDALRDADHRADGIQGHLHDRPDIDRKSTRLNSSHVAISYAVFCLKKKKINKLNTDQSSINSSESPTLLHLLS